MEPSVIGLKIRGLKALMPGGPGFFNKTRITTIPCASYIDYEFAYDR
jgi:hypothetical protein